MKQQERIEDLNRLKLINNELSILMERIINLKREKKLLKIKIYN